MTRRRNLNDGEAAEDSLKNDFEYFARHATVFALAVGCALVLWPFMAAALFAVVVCVSSWPLYAWLFQKMHGRQNLAAFTMTLGLVLIAILPLALVAYNLADNVTGLYNDVRRVIESGPLEPPAWLKGIPIVGNSADAYWHLLTTNKEEVSALERRLLEPAKNFLLSGGMLLGQGVLEMSLATLICFFLYRDGLALMDLLNMAADRMLGAYAANILGRIENTVRGVMYGLLGTALAQGSLAAIGFFIAGVPGALFLGLTTCLLSVVPVGPPLVWIGAALWLFYHGSVGWGIFMVLWGFFLISGIDNVLKPLLISRSSDMPFILVLFGVMGGVLAFGFVGLFIGPTLLAVGVSLIHEWATRQQVD